MDWFNYLVLNSVVVYGDDQLCWQMCMGIFSLRMVEWVQSEYLYYDQETGALEGFFSLNKMQEWDVFLQAISDCICLLEQSELKHCRLHSNVD